MTTYAVLNFGYVESTGLATIVASHQSKFPSEEDASADFAAMLLKKYKDNFANTVTLKKCCEKSSKISDNNFCSKCGRSLKAASFDQDEYREWLLSLGSMDLDSFGYDCEEWEFGVSAIELTNLKSTDMVFSINEAEKELVLLALGES